MLLYAAAPARAQGSVDGAVCDSLRDADICGAVFQNASLDSLSLSLIGSSSKSGSGANAPAMVASTRVSKSILLTLTIVGQRFSNSIPTSRSPLGEVAKEWTY